MADSSVGRSGYLLPWPIGPPFLVFEAFLWVESINVGVSLVGTFLYFVLFLFNNVNDYTTAPTKTTVTDIGAVWYTKSTTSLSEEAFCR